ncbi:MAG: rhomboid family intramembrane serine protease, partial [Gemmatimonadota bacterium]|nr:rhomboid family intramembrane serine protease [Gemmatimonadota bacterium]
MMIPLKDETPSGRVPVLMIGILLTNVGIFVYGWLLGDIGFHVLNARYGAIPFEIMHGIDAISPTPIPIYLTLLSSMFMHGGILHLGGNMLYLWIFGNNIEAA